MVQTRSQTRAAAATAGGSRKGKGKGRARRPTNAKRRSTNAKRNSTNAKRKPSSTLKRTHHFWLLAISPFHILLVLAAGITDLSHFLKKGGHALMTFLRNAPLRGRPQLAPGSHKYYCERPGCKHANQVRKFFQGTSIANLKLCERCGQHFFGTSVASNQQGFFVNLYREGQTVLRGIEAQLRQGAGVGTVRFQAICSGAKNSELLYQNTIASKPNLAPVAKQAVKAAKSISQAVFAARQVLPPTAGQFTRFMQRVTITTEGVNEIVVGEPLMGEEKFTLEDGSSSYNRKARIALWKELKRMNVAAARARFAEVMGAHNAVHLPGNDDPVFEGIELVDTNAI